MNKEELKSHPSHRSRPNFFCNFPRMGNTDQDASLMLFTLDLLLKATSMINKSLTLTLVLSLTLTNLNPNPSSHFKPNPS